MSVPAVSTTDLAPNLERCFLFDAVEDSYEVSGISGRLPAWLRGSYYVNGPARFERAGQRLKHWLDGDGMVCSLRFSDDGVRFTNRFVRTPKLAEEEAAGRFLYRGFGTSFPGSRLRHNVMLEPPINVSAYPFAGRLLAFAEQAMPYELDPLTLETRGQFDFHGKINEITPFAAHAKLDGHLMNFGVSFSATQPMLNVYEFDEQAHLVARKRHALRWPHSIHDFFFTPHYYVFFVAPLLMDFGKFWGEGLSVMESLSWEPEKGSEIVLIPRGRKGPAVSIPAGHGYCLHFINCFEQDDRVVVDILELDEPVYKEYQPIPDLFPAAPGCRPVRFVVDPARGTLLERIAMSYDRTPDFSSVPAAQAGHPYTDFWMLGISEAGREGRKFFDQLAHGSWKHGGVADVYQFPKGEYVGGEPVHIANPANPEEGVVIVEHLIPGEGKAEALVFDSASVASGPIVRLPLRHQIHPGFHSSFAFAND